MNLKKIKIIFIILAIVYVIFPLDLLPDLLGLVGRIDDLTLIAFLIWKYRQLKAKAFNYSNHKETQTKNEAPFCPYKILEIDKNAKKTEITKAYKQKLKEYHPDKVQHLGADLKELAKVKILDVKKAYERLK